MSVNQEQYSQFVTPVSTSGGAGGSASEYWSEENSFNVLDQEMLGPVFPPSGFLLYRLNLALVGTLFGGVPGNNPVGVNLNPAANVLDYQYENSWLYMAGAATGGGVTWDSWYLAERIAARPKYGIYRSRLTTLQDNANAISTRESSIAFASLKEVAGVPNGLAHYAGISTQAGLIGWTGSGIGGTIYNNWGATPVVQMQDAEVVISFEDTIVRVGLKGANGFLTLGNTEAAAVAVGAPMYFGWILNIFGGAVCRVGVDYRRLVTSLTPLPVR